MANEKCKKCGAYAAINCSIADCPNQVSDYKKLMQADRVTYGASTMHNLYGDLKEHAVYLVAVCYAPGNPVHEAVMLTGFKSGSYWMLCSTGYELPTQMREVYALQVIKELHAFDKKVR